MVGARAGPRERDWGNREARGGLCGGFGGIEYGVSVSGSVWFSDSHPFCCGGPVPRETGCHNWSHCFWRRGGGGDGNVGEG